MDFEKIISKMTLEEKIGLIHGGGLFRNTGIPRLNIKTLIMSDGPLGVHFDYKDDSWERINEEECLVSWLPSTAALASTWNIEAASAFGTVLGEEARARGKDIILAPGVNIMRTPLCGRNFEYMSEDPCLAGNIAESEVKAIQENDVSVCVKHFALNNQEQDRMEVDVHVSKRALYEIYLPAFKKAVQEGGAYSVMCAYNAYDGAFASANKTLLTDILRDEWGFDGIVISDWGSVHSTEDCINSGLDIEMDVRTDFDEYFFAKPLLDAVREGRIDESLIDVRVKRILELQDKLNMYDEDRKEGSVNTYEHHQALLDIAREGIVLLKNEDNALPLDETKIKSIAVIGDAATRKLAPGGWSSEVSALFEITPLEGLEKVVGEDVKIRYAPGYSIVNDSKNDSVDLKEESSSKENIGSDKNALLAEAIALAKECDAVIFFGGFNRDDDTEGSDKASYDLPYGQYELIDALLDVNPNTVIHINSGSAISLSQFSGRAKAILWSSMLGMMGGIALAEVIFGKVNPSGKLPVSFPKKLSDCSAHCIGEYPWHLDENGRKVCDYDEGIYVGYRHYLTRGIKTDFIFGHGLSYTTFEYSDINVSDEGDGIRVNVTITNTGDMEGKDVLGLYVTNNHETPDTPLRELCDFGKINLEAGGSGTISLYADNSALAYYSEEKAGFVTDPGKYTISIGKSAEDIIFSYDFIRDSAV